MTSPIVNDISPRNQYIALAGSTIFFYEFVIFVASDLGVYSTPAGQIPSAADKLQLTVDYNVDGVGNSNGGNVILKVAANADDIITLEREAPIERITNFNPGEFSVEEMNDALNTQVTFSQDNEMVTNKLTPSYTNSAIVLPGQVLLPQLGDAEFWIGSPTGTGISKAKLSQAPECANLRADLAVEDEFVDGARLVGYYDDQPITGVGPTTVRDALSRVIAEVIIPLEEQISANNNIILGGDFSTNPFQEGESFSAAEIGEELYIADGWVIQKTITAAMAVDTEKDPNFPVPISQSNVFSDASLKITNFTPQLVLAAIDRLILKANIEGYYFRKIAQRTFFLSFFARSTVTGIYCVAFVSNGQDTSFVAEYEILVANVWQHITIEVPPSPALGGWGDYKTQRGVALVFTLAAGVDNQQSPNVWLPSGNKISTANQVNFFDSGAGATFNINLIQVEPAKKTPFEMRSQEQELAFAQRYFEKSYGLAIAPGTAGTLETAGVVKMTAAKTISAYVGLQKTFNTLKRVTPVMTWYNPRETFAGRLDVSGAASVILNSLIDGVCESNTGIPHSNATVGDGIDLSGQYVANARMPL